MTQYADDCTLFLADINNIPEALALINRFTEVSGLKLNIDKTEAMGLGAYKNNEDNTFGVKFVDKPLKCLGIFVGSNETVCNEKTGMKKLQKLRQSWHRGNTET